MPLITKYGLYHIQFFHYICLFLLKCSTTLQVIPEGKPLNIVNKKREKLFKIAHIGIPCTNYILDMKKKLLRG